MKMHTQHLKKHAFVTFLMLNDSFLPGALLLAYALRKQKTEADIVCMVTEEITREARVALELLFDHVIPVDKIFIYHKRRQERQDRPFLFTRFNALRLGKDGDLGFCYEKIVLLDADVLPLKDFDNLFTLDAPAGIPNEDKTKVYDASEKDRSKIGRWGWHEQYESICPHGNPIPREITDRVIQDPGNMGVNSSLLVIRPSLQEFKDILQQVELPEIQELIGDKFAWPEMQYLTMRWSGQWHSVDIRYSGMYGYPNLRALNGAHYAGVKPWSFRRNAKAIKRYSRYADFQYWFSEFKQMLQNHPKLRTVKRLSRLLEAIEELGIQPGM